MKAQVVPFVTNITGWWSAVGIYNHSNQEHSIEIKVISNEEVINTFNKIINPWGQITLLESDLGSGQISVCINGPDCIMVTPMIDKRPDPEEGGGGFGILPVFDATTLEG